MAGGLESRVSGHRLDVVAADAAAYERLVPLAVKRSADTLTLGLPTDGTATRVRALLDEIDPERRDVVSFTVRTARRSTTCSWP